MEYSLEQNAFRILCLPADAPPKEVYKQQRRIENALEIGDHDWVDGFSFVPAIPLSQETILDAVHRIEKQRELEELFWVHDLEGKFEFQSGTADRILATLRYNIGQNTTKSAVAQHNLAVIQSYLALNVAGTRRIEYWSDALRYWNKTLDNNIFWQFMQDRAETLNDGRNGNHQDLRTAAKDVLRRVLMNEVWATIDTRDYKAAAGLAAIIREHTQVFGYEDFMSDVGERLANDGLGRIGSVMDRLAGIKEDTDKQIARKQLLTAEADLRRIAQDCDAAFAAFSDKKARRTFRDARALALQKLSILYFNVVGDEEEALRLVVEAQAFAQDLEIKETLADGWRHVQRALCCSEAIALLKQKNFVAAQDKLATALKLSTEEQKAEIEEMQETVHRQRIFADVDTTNHNPSLSTYNGIGTKFYGKRDYDAKTNSYITVHWLVLLFLPIIPLASYRVTDIGADLYRIYGRVPLTPFLRKYRWCVVAAIVLFAIFVMVSNNDSSSYPSSSNPYVYTPPRTSSPKSGSGVSRLAGDETPITSNEDFDQRNNRPPVVGGSSFATRQAEKAAIESERQELQQLGESIDLRKQRLDNDSAELQVMQSYMTSVRSNYTEDTVPEYIRQKYNQTVREYNSKLAEHNSAVDEYNTDLRQYRGRIADFNRRVDRYNANR
ncbi:MAG TPA: hypothetical protein VN577_04985 [Terriglobales bacterium]|nr:hypothetical protein [Terriglobales bacterium]